MKAYFILILSLIFALNVSAQNNRLTGRVINSSGKPLAGSTIKISGSSLSVSSDSSGHFSIPVPQNSTELQVSFIGYKTRLLPVSLPAGFMEIVLTETATELQAVEVSTGYESLPKERATGSFVQVDNQLLNRRLSTGILSRLEDMVPGLVFNRGRTGEGPNDISIRGRSTIYSNASPLIVLDNFPYEGDINSINPNDVESITVLKDAAAASIWGARAGNGVIVITTKKGGFDKPMQVSFNSNVTAGQKLNSFYRPQMSSAEYIEMEKLLFDKGYYNNKEQFFPYEALTPVVELLIAKRDGLLAGARADSEIEALKSLDVRNDFDKYLNSNSLNQQYALNLNGGTENQRYFISGGVDRNLSGLIGNNYNRFTLNASNTYSLLKKRLNLTTGIYYAQSREENNNAGTSSIRLSDTDFLYPYAKLADENGQPLAVTHDYRKGFIAQAQGSGLLNWEYKPLEDLALADNASGSTDYRMNTGLKYTTDLGLSMEVLYQYNRVIAAGRNLQGEASYYTRNQVNRFSRITDTGLITPVPAGGILDLNNRLSSGHNLRGQMNFNRQWKPAHQLNMLAGAELRTLDADDRSTRLYGYDDDLAIQETVDYLTRFPQFYNPGFTTAIINRNYLTGIADRFRSVYANGAYTFQSKYTLSASGRIDQSNLFGVRANQKGVPLWSAGLSWNLSAEEFYKFALFPYLKLRTTYGYNGNINKNITAFTTARAFSGSRFTNLPYQVILNPPNPQLRWERVRMVNFGLDFSSLGDRISGSLDYYRKKGIDLIGDAPVAPSSGVSVFRGNIAGTKGQGLDLVLNSRNLDNDLKWNTCFIFSYGTDQITDYDVNVNTLNYVQAGDIGSVPVIGKPLFAVYSYKWAGLDPQTGEPRGFLNGAASADYNQIISTVGPSDLVYHGSSRPLYYGALRNTLTWKSISVSASLSYRLGYFFRKESVMYGSVLGANGGHGDFSLRWQTPGDERITNVPSLPSVSSSNRDYLYLYSEVLVHKGDHIRLQDVNLSYDLAGLRFIKLPFKQAQLYLYANNIGLLWKANDAGIDPDYQVGPPVRTLAAGFKVDF